jgi:hypothetical protein
LISGGSNGCICPIEAEEQRKTARAERMRANARGRAARASEAMAEYEGF